jgi:hypothetical protein
MMPETASPSNPMLDAALEYLESGFSVIPIRRSDKRPYVKWEEYQQRLPTRDEVESWWSNWPEANVAIICGRISGIYCVDGDGPAGKDWIAANLPPTPVYSITARGVHAIFAIPEDAVIRNKVRLAPEVDIRGEGGYFVAPPSVHETGHVYQWVLGPDAWENLPFFEPATPSKQGNLNIDLSASKTSVLFTNVPLHQRNDALVRLVGRWFGKDLDFEEVLFFAKCWNQDNLPPLGESELTRSVKSIWDSEQKKRGQEQDSGLAPYVSERVNREIPEAILHPGGLLEDVMDYIAASSPVSHPIFNLAGAVALVGTLVGQKVMTETGLRTNFYNTACGYSGSGKDAPQRTVPLLLSMTNAARVKGPDALTSDAALLKYVSRDGQGRMVMFLDEIGLLLKGLKRPNSAAFDLPRVLMHLFGATGRPFTKSYASADDIVVPWHHVSFYGASTPERFWESITRSEASDGFLARMLVFESLHDVEPPRERVSLTTPPSLIEAVNPLYAIQTATQGGNMESVPVPHVIPKTEAAARCFHEWADEYHRLRNKFNQEDEGLSSIYGRAAEHAHKLALVHTVSLHGPDIISSEVDVESVEWAMQTVTHLITNLVERIRENITENDFHALCQKIMKHILRIGTPDRPGATSRDLLRQIKVPTRIFDDALAVLKKSGEIVEQVYKPRRGREVTLYCAAKSAEEKT